MSFEKLFQVGGRSKAASEQSSKKPVRKMWPAIKQPHQSQGDGKVIPAEEIIEAMSQTGGEDDALAGSDDDE